MSRNFTIDTVRLIAAFCILTLHTDLPGFGFEINSIVRLSARWAVPFFFIATGYFLGLKIQTSNRLSFTIIEKNVINLFSIFIISSIIYLIISKLFYSSIFYNNVSFLLNGTYWHLWFISSMILGYLVIWYIFNIHFERFLPIISILILAVAVFSDSYDTLMNVNINYDELPRFLTSIPFMYTGIYLSNRNIEKQSLSIWVIIFFVGFIIQFIEAYLLYKIFGDSLLEHQMLIGTIISSVAIFIICISIDGKENIISKYGKKYSLYIYLYHIIAYWIIILLFRFLDIVVSDFIKILIPVIGFLITLGSAVFLDKVLPRIFSFLNGNINTPLGNKRIINRTR